MIMDFFKTDSNTGVVFLRLSGTGVPFGFSIGK